MNDGKRGGYLVHKVKKLVYRSENVHYNILIFLKIHTRTTCYVNVGLKTGNKSLRTSVG